MGISHFSAKFSKNFCLIYIPWIMEESVHHADTANANFLYLYEPENPQEPSATASRSIKTPAQISCIRGKGLPAIGLL